MKKLLVRIQGTRHLLRYTGKFVISGVRYTGIQLYDARYDGPTRSLKNKFNTNLSCQSLVITLEYNLLPISTFTCPNNVH